MEVNKSIRQKLRASFLWLHRWIGIISGTVVLIVALTGCIYVFEEEIRNTFQHKFYYVNNVGVEKLALQNIQEIAQKQLDKKDKIKSIRIKEVHDAAYIVATEKDKLIAINPYTGEVIGVKNTKRDFLSVVLQLHRTLLLGKVGKQIIKWNVALFFVLCISGLVLWWPKQKKLFKKAATIHFRTKNKKLFNWELHSVLGFYSVFFLLLISFTGMIFAFDGIKDLLKMATNAPIGKGGKGEKVKIKPDSVVTFHLQTTYDSLKTSYAGTTETFIIYPKDSNEALRITLQYPYAVVRKQNQFFINPYSGNIEKKMLYKDYKTYDNIIRSNYQLHTGNIPTLGLGSKILFFLVSLFAASLPITGFIIWWGRGRKSKETA
jgi:uncharacterized iron-regulated membrane protein